MPANAYIVQASGAQTTDGASAAFHHSSGAALRMVVSVTTGAGTVTTFRVFAQGSPDNGATWIDMPFDHLLKSGVAAPGNISSGQRDLVNESARVASAQWYGVISNPMQYMRASWVIAGTSPSQTFSILALGIG